MVMKRNLMQCTYATINMPLRCADQDKRWTFQSDENLRSVRTLLHKSTPRPEQARGRAFCLAALSIADVIGGQLLGPQNYGRVGDNWIDRSNNWPSMFDILRLQNILLRSAVNQGNCLSVTLAVDRWQQSSRTIYTGCSKVNSHLVCYCRWTVVKCHYN